MIKMKDAAKSGFDHALKIFEGEEDVVKAVRGVFNDCEYYDNRVHDRRDSYDDYDERDQ